MKENKLSPQDEVFIRSQHSDAIPFLVELFGIPRERVLLLRRKMVKNAEPMPVRLLRELVQQRKTPPRALDFLHRPSSMVLAERWA